MIITMDIGGTKTLWTIWNNSQVIDRGHVLTNTIKDFTEFIKTLIDEFESSHHDAPSTHKITRLSLSFAGPVTGTALELTNTGQQIDLAHIHTAFPHMEVIALNDLEALAHSIGHLTGSEQLALFRSAASSAAKGALHDAKDTLHDTKGAPAGAKQRSICDKLSKQYGHVSYEMLLSGQGLSNIFACILEELEEKDTDAIACRPRQKMYPAQITAMAKSGNSEALEAFRIFSEILGAACSNYALVYNATGGIYIGGGMIPKILPLINKEAFENAFLNKGRFKDFLNNTPVYVILDETAPSIGAMRAI